MTAAVAVVSALLMITRKNPIMSVLFLIVNFFCLALMYLILRAQFIAIIQILVYAGAIMVLFLFTIMLLNLGDEEQLKERISFQKFLALALSGVLFFIVMMAIGMPTGTGPSQLHENAAQIGTVESIGKVLFTEYLFQFEVTSLLLLAALVGVVLLAKKKME